MLDTNKLDYDRLSVLTGVLLLALVMMRFLELPELPLLQATVLGSPIGFDLSAGSLMILITLAMSITAVASMVGSHPLSEERMVQHGYMFWIVPGLLIMALAVWLNEIDELRAWIAGIVASAVIIPVALSVECRAVDETQRSQRSLSWFQQSLIYLSAVIFFALIYDARLRSMLSVSLVALISALLSIRLFWITAASPGELVQYGVVTGLIVGQMTWGLNYWGLSGMQGGLLLLLAFYLVAGLIQQFLQGQFNGNQTSRRILLEYGGLAFVALFLIVFAAS